jgi:hypothetical protein
VLGSRGRLFYNAPVMYLKHLNEGIRVSRNLTLGLIGADHHATKHAGIDINLGCPDKGTATSKTAPT